jgi:hypothetical protein
MSDPEAGYVQSYPGMSGQRPDMSGQDSVTRSNV